MQEFRADILETNTRGKILFFSAVALLAIVTIVLLVLGLMPAIAPIFWIAVFVYGVSKYFLQTRKQVLKKSIGELVINNEKIIALNEGYSINELKSIRIEFY